MLSHNPRCIVFPRYREFDHAITRDLFCHDSFINASLFAGLLIHMAVSSRSSMRDFSNDHGPPVFHPCVSLDRGI